MTARRPWREILLNKRMLICIFQGFSSGLPLYVIIQLVPAWLRTRGVDLATIGVLGLSTLPYTLKFLWAPLLDRCRLPFLGRRRGWQLLSQLLLIVSISQLGSVDPTRVLWAAVVLIFACAFFGATQDIALDAYRRELLSDDELGMGNSIFTNTFRIASLVPGSLALILADLLPWSVVYWVVALFMLIGVVTTLLVPETSDDSTAPHTVVEAVVEPFVEFFGRGGWRSALLMLAFIALYKLGDNMATALQTPFFIDTGFTLTEIGTVAKFSILVSSILGTALGGVIMLKLSINRALWVFGIVQMASILGFAALAQIGHNLYALAGAASFEYIGVGSGTVALVAFMARETSTRFTATQFALLSSLVAVPRTLASATTGYLIDAIGYFSFFLLCTALAVPGMLLLLAVAPWSATDDSRAPNA